MKTAAVKTRKGIYYFPTHEDALAWAACNPCWPSDRVIRFEVGWAIQAGKSGNYAGPGVAPRKWGE